MSNDDVYAGGLLNRALDPATQPPEIQRFLRAELDLVREVIEDGMRVLDVGCGTGRHLLLLRDRLGHSVGLDYERSYIAEAAQHAGAGRLHFITGDATAIPLVAEFDFAVCLTNTWGTMADKAGVLREMRRLAPRPYTRLLSVYSESSIPPGGNGIDDWGTMCWMRQRNIWSPMAAFGPSTSPPVGFGA